MPEEPPAPVEKPVVKAKMAGTSESSDQSNSDESDSSSSEESESESERASQLSYLQKQVREQLLGAKDWTRCIPLPLPLPLSSLPLLR